MYMSLCLLVTLSATESAEQFKINKIVYVENGADFVELSCGDVPQAAVGIHWFIYNGTEWVKLLKIYKAQPGRNPDPNASTKYGVSKSVNTSLVVRNIKLSDSASFKCGSLGNSTQMRCIRLQVVGKSLVTYLFIWFPLAEIKYVICLKSKDIFMILSDI